MELEEEVKHLVSPQLGPDKSLADRLAWSILKQLTKSREFVGLNANNKVQLGVGQNFDNGVNLYFDL